MEKSSLGLSINDLKTRLVTHGYDETLLESQLSERGHVKGSRIRDVRYKVLETRKYEVDDNFPKITKNSFKMYNIDLTGTPFNNW